MATKPRSPNYPGISLMKAIEFARKLYAVNHLHKATPEVVSKAMGYTSLNGSSLTVIAALKKYGLIEDDGKELRISKDALTILVEPSSSHERARTIVRAAHKPELFAELQAAYPGSVPNDEILRAWFLRKGFLQSTVDMPIRAYRETMELATAQQSLYASTTPPAAPTPAAPPLLVPKVGDFVQWESAGTLMFEQPRRVIGVTADEQFVFVEGSATGVPAKETTVVSPPAPVAPATPAMTPPLAPAASLPVPTNVAPPPQQGTRQDTFSLDEGQVVLQWPEKLSAASYEDFESWIQLQLRKIKRAIVQ